MKAWLVGEKDEFAAAVVFAETRNEARSRVMGTEEFETADYINIEAHRMKAADKYYTDGKTRLDWLDPDDRLVLVKECGFVCDPDAFYEGDCETCTGKEYCDRYKNLSEERMA